MRKVPVREAVGSTLCHDITRIVPGVVQEAAFKKGHRVRPEDVDVLLKLGKEHLYVWEPQPGMVHEDDAAIRIAQAAIGEGIAWSEPSEGKVELRATRPGVLRIDTAALLAVNRVADVTLITRKRDETIYEAGEQVAATRVIPLLIAEERVAEVEAIGRAAGGILSVAPFRIRRAGVVVTGNEVYHGRIQDGFGPVLREKFRRLGCDVMDVLLAPDDPAVIVERIARLVEAGAELIAVTGGMSVDPDDRTPAAIRAAGAEIVSYGVPMLPGNMLLVAYLGTVPVMGLPGCVMFKEKTSFDVIAPRLLTGERLTKEHIVSLGEGGLLAHC